MIYCECSRCLALADLAVSLALAGYLMEASVIASQVSTVATDDYYTDAWREPTWPSPSEDLTTKYN